MSEGGWAVILIAIAAVVWFWQGDPPRDLRRLFGQQTYEDRMDEFRSYVAKNKHGSSGDVWLVKGTFGVPDRVALFFGYLDDWATCYEFATMYMQRYPSDTYSCEFAN